MKEPVAVPIALQTMVQELVNESNVLVLGEVLHRMSTKAHQSDLREVYGVNEDWHKLHKSPTLNTRGCGCAYCTAVHKYVIAKVSAHRQRRRMDSYDYIFHPYDSTEDYRLLKQLEVEWRELREVSHQIRDLLGMKEVFQK